MDGIVENNVCSVDFYYGNVNMYNYFGEEVLCNSEDFQGVLV